MFSFLARKNIACVAINMRSVRGPWGGSSVFVQQMEAVLHRRGYRVTYSLQDQPDAVILIDPRDDLQNKTFGIQELRRCKQIHPQMRIMHRINECDQRKKTNFMDDLLREANELADHTVFISAWLKDYFVSRWFEPTKAYSVVYNGADPAIFHPIGSKSWNGTAPFRLVTHHWSDNPMKGFPVYQLLDDLIASGKLPGIEFWIIGRWPASVQWKAARTFSPVAGKPLADLLRQCHAYITASLWEPCGMHHIEGAQCALPLLYHRDGGGIVEAGRCYGIEFNEDSLAEAVQEMQCRYAELRNRLLTNMPSGDLMAVSCANIIQDMLCR